MKTDRCILWQGEVKPEAVAAFLERVVRDSETDCWRWTGPRMRSGYGTFCFRGYQTTAHRAAWLLLCGPIPSHLHVDHLCRVRDCVNPAHLEPVTQAENTRRAKALITHCPRGHAFDSIVRNGRKRGVCRSCRTCRRERMREYRAAHGDRVRETERRSYWRKKAQMADSCRTRKAVGT